MQLMQVPMIVGASYMATISLLPHPLDEPQTAGVNPLSFAREREKSGSPYTGGLKVNSAIAGDGAR
jgi:hypothetical protein